MQHGFAMAEEALRAWFQHRDGEAFRVIVNTYGGMVFASARRVLGNDSDAEEVTQESFLALATAARPPTAPLGPWLHRVAVNRAINLKASARRRALREAEHGRAQPPCEGSPWASLEPLLDEALAELPERYRELVVLHYLEGKSQRQIARDLDLPRQTVGYRLEKALRLLRTRLARRGVQIGAPALGVLLAARIARAMPAGLGDVLGKVAIVGACANPAVFPMAHGATTTGGLIMSSKMKAALATASVLLLLMGVPAMRAGDAPSPPDVAADPGASGGPAALEALAPPQPPAAPAPDPPTEPTAAVAERPDAPQVGGIWIATSYVWRSSFDEAPAEWFDGADMPLFRMQSDDTELTLAMLEPWGLDAPYASFEGTRAGEHVRFVAHKDNATLVLEGRFRANWTQIECSGGYDLEGYAGEDRDRASMYHLALALEKAPSHLGASTLASEQQRTRRREEGTALAEALHAYARDHEGRLPIDLGELVPGYLPESALPRTGGDRWVRLHGGQLPAGLLDAGQAWERFFPEDPMPERLAKWEAYQRERWGSGAPVLPPVATLAYRNPYLEISIDALGRTSERAYRLEAVGPEDRETVLRMSAQQLREVALAVMVFRDGHGGHAPAGWLSLYPRYLESETNLTHPMDAPGALSYHLVEPGRLEAGAEGLAPHELPVAMEDLDFDPGLGGRNVVFSDGSVRLVSEEDLIALLDRLDPTH